MNKDFLRRELDNKIVEWQEKKQKMLEETRALEQQKVVSDTEKLKALAGEYAGATDDNLVAPKEEIKQKVFEKVDPSTDRAEKYLLCAMVHQKPYAFVKSNIRDLFGNNYRDLYDYYYTNRDSATESFALEVHDKFYPSYGNRIIEIINNFAESDDEEFDAQFFKDCLWRLYQKKLEQDQKRINEELTKESDTQKRQELIVELAKVVDKLKSKKVDL